ncbi:MAG: ATP-binding protein [Eubacteriaceae bacterium]|nr:ATP-binding protein [Eubacteriaceae bacterium]
MKKKINVRFFEIAVFSIIITTLVMTAVFYTQLKKQVFSDLQIVADILIEEDSLDKKVDNLRITVINEDGSVVYDSDVEASRLPSHLNRPEVISAIETGVGEGVRRSDTLAASVFYYAVRMENGQILRVGKEAHSVISVLIAALPIIVGTALLLALICMVLSHYLTKAIIRPIDKMAGDLDHIKESEVYPEMIPFARKIRAQHEEILSAANTRQEFTANVTHELKTPLAAISGYAELMEAGMANDSDIKRFSGEIRKSAARLLTLINDIIKLSQLDAGNASEVLEIVNIAEIASDSVEMLSLGASKNQITVRYEGVQDAGVRIGKELAQELTFNLIENAIRYNRVGGSVTVSVLRENGKILFSVEDTGIGIPAEHQKRIFERFYRVDKSRSKELGGTGLGLAIVKHICSLTDGQLSLESEDGKGTKVSITWDVEE